MGVESVLGSTGNRHSQADFTFITLQQQPSAGNASTTQENKQQGQKEINDLKHKDKTQAIVAGTIPTEWPADLRECLQALKEIANYRNNPNIVPTTLDELRKFREKMAEGGVKLYEELETARDAAETLGIMTQGRDRSSFPSTEKYEAFLRQINPEFEILTNKTELFSRGLRILDKGIDEIERGGTARLQSTPSIAAAIVPPTMTSQRDNLIKTLFPIAPLISISLPGFGIQPAKSAQESQTQILDQGGKEKEIAIPPSTVMVLPLVTAAVARSIYDSATAKASNALHDAKRYYWDRHPGEGAALLFSLAAGLMGASSGGGEPNPAGMMPLNGMQPPVKEPVHYVLNGGVWVEGNGIKNYQVTLPGLEGRSYTLTTTRDKMNLYCAGPDAAQPGMYKEVDVVLLDGNRKAVVVPDFEGEGKDFEQRTYYSADGVDYAVLHAQKSDGQDGDQLDTLQKVVSDPKFTSALPEQYRPR